MSNLPEFFDILLIVAIVPDTNPFMSWPLTKLKAPGINSSIFINSLVDIETFKSTGIYEVPTKANNFSPTLNLEFSWVTLNCG